MPFRNHGILAGLHCGIILVALLCAPAFSQGTTTFDLHAAPASAQPESKIAWTNAAAVAYVLDSAITIDGDLSDWPSNAPLLTASSPFDPKDLAAGARVAVSPTSFYISCDVTDDVHNMHGYGDNMWQYDSVQFALDPLCLRTIGRYGDYGYEIGMCEVNGDPMVWRWQRPPGVRGEQVRAADLAVKLSERRAVYEARIPLQELWPLRPELGASGFAYLVNDRDKGDRDGYSAWASGIGSGKDASAFGALSFAKPPPRVQVAARFLLPVDPTPSTQPQEWNLAVYAAAAGRLTVTCDGDVEHGPYKGADVSGNTSFDVPAGLSHWDLSADLSQFAPARLRLRPAVTLDGAEDLVPAHEFVVYVYSRY